MIKNGHKILTYTIITLLLCTVFSCYQDEVINPRDNFLGTYNATETFVNPITGLLEYYHYTLEIAPHDYRGTAVFLTGYGNNGIYGTTCSIEAIINDPARISIPPFTCYYDGITTFELSGAGHLSPDGHQLTMNLYIRRCDGFGCFDQPLVVLSAQRTW